MEIASEEAGLGPLMPNGAGGIGISGGGESASCRQRGRGQGVWGWKDNGRGGRRCAMESDHPLTPNVNSKED